MLDLYIQWLVRGGAYRADRIYILKIVFLLLIESVHLQYYTFLI